MDYTRRQNILDKLASKEKKAGEAGTITGAELGGRHNTPEFADKKFPLPGWRKHLFFSPSGKILNGNTGKAAGLWAGELRAPPKTAEGRAARRKKIFSIPRKGTLKYAYANKLAGQFPDPSASGPKPQKGASFKQKPFKPPNTMPNKFQDSQNSRLSKANKIPPLRTVTGGKISASS